MGYLAENLVYFMAEAVDRNGKKDPSLGMKHPKDFVNKYKKQEDESKKDLESRKNRAFTKIQTSDSTDGRTKYMMTRPGYSDAKNHWVNASMNNREAREMNGILGQARHYERAAKAHNESALFNDPIWDKL